MHTADLVGMGGKSRQYNTFQYSVQARLSVHSIPIWSAACRYVLYKTPSSMGQNFERLKDVCPVVEEAEYEAE